MTVLTEVLMPMPTPTEKDLDAALEHAFINDANFVEWFVERTTFAGRGARYVWSRSNYAYGKFPYESADPATGQTS